MSELGSSAAVGIESVEWLDADGGQLTVQVTGRWRRRRGWVESRGQTTLVIEAEGRRHRFPATPEPPSLGGAAPGTWRLSFSVPAELAHGLAGHVWLALGTVTVPLPVPDSAAGAGVETDVAEQSSADTRLEGPGAREGIVSPKPPGSPEPPESPDSPSSPEGPAPSATQSEREPGSLEIERAWRRADAAERAAGELGERVSALERALERERDEHALRTARLEPVQPAGAEQDRLRAEDALRTARRAADVRVPAEPPLLPAPMTAFQTSPPAWPPGGAGGDVRSGDLDTIAALHRELGARVAAEAGLRARTVQAETRLAVRVLLEQRTAAALGELRTELERLREALERERARRWAAEAVSARLRAELGGQRERSRDAHAAIEELRTAIELLRPAPQAPPQAAPAGQAVTPDRLSDALTRLRQNAEPRDDSAEPPAGVALTPPSSSSPPVLAALVPPTSAATVPSRLPVGVGGPTVEQAFRRLAARDPERAGRLLIGLLGAQRAAWPHAVAYDLVLGPGYGTVQVTVGDRGVSVERSGAARAREQVVFQVTGGPARLARLLSAGSLRRLLRVGIARVRGRREGVGALRALLALPLDLTALREAGAALDGETLFTLLAAMIDPAWTHGERFTISHTDERGHAVFLQIRDGRPPLVSLDPPAGRVASELSGPVERLWRVFADGGAQAPTSVGGLLTSGDQGPLMLVRTWANRAQSGHGAR